MKKLLISYLNVLSYFILFILFFVAFIECIQLKMVPEMCFPKEAEITECHGKYKYNCGDFVCTKNEYFVNYEIINYVVMLISLWHIFISFKHIFLDLKQ